MTEWKTDLCAGTAALIADGKELWRHTPEAPGFFLGVGGAETRETARYRVVFPKGYTKVESLPVPFEIRNPLDAGEVWVGVTVASEVKDDVLSVDIVVTRNVRCEAMLPAEYLALLKEWNRLAGSKANTTVVVRRP